MGTLPCGMVPGSHEKKNLSKFSKVPIPDETRANSKTFWEKKIFFFWYSVPWAPSHVAWSQVGTKKKNLSKFSKVPIPDETRANSKTF